jgi:hypothetical protein
MRQQGRPLGQDQRPSRRDGNVRKLLGSVKALVARQLVLVYNAGKCSRTLTPGQDRPSSITINGRHGQYHHGYVRKSRFEAVRVAGSTIVCYRCARLDVVADSILDLQIQIVMVADSLSILDLSTSIIVVVWCRFGSLVVSLI